MATLGPPKVVSGIVDGPKRGKTVAQGEALTAAVGEELGNV